MSHGPAQNDSRKLREAEPVRDQGQADRAGHEDVERATQSAILNAGRGNPNWIATTPREAFFLLGQFAITRAGAAMELPPTSAGCRKRRASRGRLDGVAGASTPTCPGATLLAAMVPLRGEDVQVRPRHVRPRAGRTRIIGDNYPVPDRMLRAQRAHRARVPAVGDVREPAAGRHVRSLRGRGRHGGDVLHLQVAEGQPPAAPRRHHRARHADLHALHRDDRTSRTTTSRWSTSRRRRRTASSSPTRRSKKLEDPKIKAFFLVNPGNPPPWRCSQETIGKLVEAGEDEAARPDAPHRRRVRHLRARTSGRCSASCRRTRSASTPTRSTSAARAGGSASSRSTRTTSSTR